MSNSIKISINSDYHDRGRKAVEKISDRQMQKILYLRHLSLETAESYLKSNGMEIKNVKNLRDNKYLAEDVYDINLKGNVIDVSFVTFDSENKFSFIGVAKRPFDAGIECDYYIGVKLDKDLTSAEIMGYITKEDVYEALSDPDELIQNETHYFIPDLLFTPIDFLLEDIEENETSLSTDVIENYITEQVLRKAGKEILTVGENTDGYKNKIAPFKTLKTPVNISKSYIFSIPVKIDPSQYQCEDSENSKIVTIGKSKFHYRNSNLQDRDLKFASPCLEGLPDKIIFASNEFNYTFEINDISETISINFDPPQKNLNISIKGYQYSFISEDEGKTYELGIPKTSLKPVEVFKITEDKIKYLEKKVLSNNIIESLNSVIDKNFWEEDELKKALDKFNFISDKDKSLIIAASKEKAVIIEITEKDA